MEKFRTSLLAVIFGSVFFVLGRINLAPSGSDSTVTPFVFPKDVPLLEWQSLESRPLATPIPKSRNFHSGSLYRYIQNDLTLDIQMRYIVDTNGNVKYLIHKYSSMPQLSSRLSLVRQREGIGFYSLFTYQQQAYLSTCINSRGGSTVTQSQFTQNRYIYDMRVGRLLPWLLGQGTVRDKRCLWAHLSIPLKNSAPEEAYQTLEKAWESWYQWWHPRFPQP